MFKYKLILEESGCYDKIATRKYLIATEINKYQNCLAFLVNVL